MDYIGLIISAIGLSMDAFTVSIANAAINNNIKFKKAILTAFSFGFFQFLMPIIGWGIGKAGEHLVSHIYHWVAFFLLSYIGIKMIYDNIHNDLTNSSQSIDNIKKLILLSIATSIDALASGIILPSTIGASSIRLMIVSTLIIGITTFSLCFIGVYIGKKFGTVFTSKSGIIGGVILIVMGIKILIQHIFF